MVSLNILTTNTDVIVNALELLLSHWTGCIDFYTGFYFENSCSTLCSLRDHLQQLQAKSRWRRRIFNPHQMDKVDKVLLLSDRESKTSLRKIRDLRSLTSLNNYCTIFRAILCSFKFKSTKLVLTGGDGGTSWTTLIRTGA